jgi:nitrite reductase (NADH) small subunit
VTAHTLFPQTELAPGEVRQVTVDGIAIVVMRTTGGRLCALRDACPHQGAMLSEGALEAAVDGADVGLYELRADRAVLRCPWHGYEFDVDDGRCLADPRSRVRAYPVSVENGIVTLER